MGKFSPTSLLFFPDLGARELLRQTSQKKVFHESSLFSFTTFFYYVERSDRKKKKKQNAYRQHAPHKNRALF
jgi:hypothetical protein